MTTHQHRILLHACQRAIAHPQDEQKVPVEGLVAAVVVAMFAPASSSLPPHSTACLFNEYRWHLGAGIRDCTLHQTSDGTGPLFSRP
jgi:hypothetical protein